MLPMCVSTCPCRANFFGNLDDKESLLYKMMKSNPTQVLKSVRADKADGPMSRDLRGKTAAQIGQTIGYPGKIPVFAERAGAKPRVFYILP
ncbi:MAG TPA: hypothetical protein VGJ94_12860 [Syntrophorhabdaceae bacterium]|jgi:Fe-S-cluster-containing dehydrogenase component